MFFSNNPILTAGDMSTSLTSDIEDMTRKIWIAIQAVYTGSPVGDLTLEASNDKVTWTTVANSTVAVSGASSAMWNIQNCGYSWLRLVYTRTSGTGSLTARNSSKGG